MLLSKQDKEGSTPLHKAAFNGDVDVLKLFLDAGVDLNVVDKEVCSWGRARGTVAFIYRFLFLPYCFLFLTYYFLFLFFAF